MAPPKLDKLPILGFLIKWFKTEELVIDNDLFRLHHQISTFFLTFGLIVSYIENHFDGKAITCNGADAYAKAYCWLHGTGYLPSHLQGRATGCYVDQAGLASPNNNARVTDYYLWLPMLFVVCFGLARMSRMLWRRYLERGIIKAVLADKKSATAIAAAFLDYRPCYGRYEWDYAFCELLNLLSTVFSVAITNQLLRGKFLNYGPDVAAYYHSLNTAPAPVTDPFWQPHQQLQQHHHQHLQPQLMHNPMCELFPTEVACHIEIGALTGGIDRLNYLCILSNNLFNQGYFLFLWAWWAILLVLSVLGLIYRITRLASCRMSRAALERKLRPISLDGLQLTGSEYFVLQRVARNLPRNMVAKLVAELKKRCCKKKEKEAEAEAEKLLPAEDMV